MFLPHVLFVLLARTCAKVHTTLLYHGERSTKYKHKHKLQFDFICICVLYLRFLRPVCVSCEDVRLSTPWMRRHTLLNAQQRKNTIINTYMCSNIYLLKYICAQLTSDSELSTCVSSHKSKGSPSHHRDHGKCSETIASPPNPPHPQQVQTPALAAHTHGLQGAAMSPSGTYQSCQQARQDKASRGWGTLLYKCPSTCKAELLVGVIDT